MKILLLLLKICLLASIPIGVATVFWSFSPILGGFVAVLLLAHAF